MDVNGTRFHLLLGRHDWLGVTEPAEVAWNSDDGVLELTSLPFVFPPRSEETPPGVAARRGAGRDGFGNWYWIDDAGTGILARAPRDSAPRQFWPVTEAPAATEVGVFEATSPIEPPVRRPLTGLAVTTEHYLVTGSAAPRGLLVFDLAAGGPPLMIEWPDDVPFTADDIAAAPDGGAWILDRGNARLWSIDRQFRVRAASPAAPAAAAAPEFVPEPPPPVEPQAPLPAPAIRPLTLDASLDVSAVPGVASVEALPDGSALLLARDASHDAPALHRYTLDGADGVYRLHAQLASHPQVLELLPHAHDFAIAADLLCLVAPNGNQAFSFRISGAGALLEFRFVQAFYPMRRFGGRALVAAGGEAHYDSGERWVSLLEQPRPRYEQAGTLVLPPEGRALDGRIPGCVWHRLFIDACLPPGTRVTVESRAADSIAELTGEAWAEEPAPYLRTQGGELPWQRTQLAHEGAGTWELLFQRAVGRYLQLRLRLHGNGRATPRLHALRVYYPRFSYLREYLPAVWREDTASASFVDRFLANVEGTLTGIEGRIAAAQVLFDTRTVPAEFLEWLAAWLGASLDAAWDERRRRFFLANALRMYAGRGTKQGLVRALRLALEDCPDPNLFSSCADCAPRFGVRITERFLARSAPGVAWQDVATSTAPSTAPADGRWSPAAGADPLHAAWREWLAGQYADAEALNDAWRTSHESLEDRAIRLPATAPAGEDAAEDWRTFLRDGLQFTYAAPEAADVTLWRDYLRGRYPQPADLNRAWRLYGSARHASFDTVAFPAEMPASGPALADWIAFVSVVLPMRRGAHRFTVLVPVSLDDPPDVQRTRRDLAERVALLEKPAHTVVDSRLYWAAFQVGSARVGADSLLGPGSRFAALLLGRGELAHAHLGWTEPWNVRGRRVVGRDRVAVRLQPQAYPARCS